MTKKVASSVPTLRELVTVPADFRLYCVVANTVQAPLTLSPAINPHFGEEGLMMRVNTVEVTQSINQPPGRVVAQACHVVSLVRDRMLRQAWKKAAMLGSYCDPEFFNEYCQPLTTIVLGARDSFELQHVLNLMKLAKVPAYTFYDTDQPAYGSPDLQVMTSICTEPVHPDWMLGVTEYIPLWAPLELK